MTGVYDVDPGGGDGDPVRDAVAAGEVPVAVYGLGKMGLPLAAAMADVTGDVVGVDVDESVVRTVNDGESPIANEPGLPELVADLVADGRLRATTDGVAAASRASVHVVIVPTTLTDERAPDLSALEAVVEAVGEGLAPGDAVFVECTVPPGTCAEVVEPSLAATSGLDADAFGVAFCPERTSSGRALRDIRGAYPKVVGGTDSTTTRAAERFYDCVTDNEVIPVADATTAEAVKLFEGVYRDVNVALANELGRLSESLGIDGREAIAVANTQPFCEIHDPGPGVGGHCIPFYPHFLTSAVDVDAPLLDVSRRVNESMPGYAAGRVVDLLAERGVPIEGSRVLCLGATYRPGVAETTHTPTVPLVRRLDRLGATVHLADPLVSAADLPPTPATWVGVDEVGSTNPDAVVVVTPHESFADVDWAAFGEAVVLDARDGIEGLDAPSVGDGSRI